MSRENYTIWTTKPLLIFIFPSHSPQARPVQASPVPHSFRLKFPNRQKYLTSFSIHPSNNINHFQSDVNFYRVRSMAKNWQWFFSFTRRWIKKIRKLLLLHLYQWNLASYNIYIYIYISSQLYFFWSSYQFCSTLMNSYIQTTVIQAAYRWLSQNL